MAPLETTTVNAAGHEFRLNCAPDERETIQIAAKKVTEAIQKIQSAQGGAASPAKIATMAAFQFAYELMLADAMLDDAQRLHEDLQKQKEAVKRLEGLLARVDDALAI